MGLNHESYRRRCLELSEAFEAGDFEGAEAGWHDLLGRPELPQIDRVALMHNLALTVFAAGRHDEAEAHFDRAIEWERPLMRAMARTGKSDWLAGQGRSPEAAAILEEVAKEPWATLGESEALLRQAATLRGELEVSTPVPDPSEQSTPASEPSRKRWFGARG